RLKDRWGRDLCLGMTHEEVMTSIARGELRSYKQLPQIWYQIQNKFRDEPRPKSGLLRVRQFIMKDSYTFDLDAAGLDAAYEKHYQAYSRILERCGLEAIVVEADSGAMGGSQSHEFMVPSDAGEALVANGKPVLAMLRGDHQLSETKFASAVGATDVRPAHPHEIREWFGADAGSLGPVGVKNMPILADTALQGRRNMIAGANEDDHHL